MLQQASKRFFPEVSILIIHCGFGLLASGLIGCRAPEPVANQLPPATAYLFSTGAENRSHPDVTAVPWWHFLGSSTLDELIEYGLRSSYQIQIVEQRLLQAGALVQQSAAAGRPELNLALSGNGSVRDDGYSAHRFSAGVGGRWRIDTNRAIHHSIVAREFTKLGLEDALNMARLNLTVELANAVMDWITQERLLKLLDDQQSYAENSLNVVQARFRQGVASRLDVLQQEGLVTEIRAQRPAVLAERQRVVLRIAVLSGKTPWEMMQLQVCDVLPEAGVLPVFGQPLDLLQLRPDLRALRNTVLAADADAARAWAERWPALTLDLELLWREGRTLSEGLLSIGAGLFQPLFDGGRRRGELDRTLAVREERWNILSFAFLSAISQIEELVFAEARSEELLVHLRQREALLVEAEIQANSRYTQGLTDFLPVITARQDLLNIQQRLVREQRNRLRLRITLYGALGASVAQDMPDY